MSEAIARRTSVHRRKPHWLNVVRWGRLVRHLWRAGALAVVAVLGVMAVACGMGGGGEEFEVWVIDQSGTAGTLYIYDGKDLIEDTAQAVPEVIDLGGAVSALCQQQTGTAPARAHMVMFNAGQTHAIVSFVATGHVVFMEASTRTPKACIDVGEQAHGSIAAPDDTYLLVADQNGKKVHRISTDYGANRFSLDTAASIDLATCTTPSGAKCEDKAVRPDTAPICFGINSASRLAFVTLRGGGMFVLDSGATPMSIVAEYDKATVKGNGLCGVEIGGKMFVNAGGATKGSPRGSDLYSFALSDFPASGAVGSPNQPAPKLVFSKDEGDHDAHMILSTAGHGSEDGGLVWVVDRFANEVEVVDPETGSLVNTFGLAGQVSADPAPDFTDVSPGGDYAFIALRGACPLTANIEGVNNAVGATPGVGVIKVEEDGVRGQLVGIAPINSPAPAGFDCPSRSDDPAGSITNQADPHGLRVRAK